MPDAVLVRVLLGIYGPGQVSMREARPGSDAPPLRRTPCASAPAPADPSHRWLLAVCMANEDAGHAEAGAIDFFVLDPAANWATVASLRDQPSGNAGYPGTVVLSAAGYARPAFIVEESWSGQGYTLGTRTIVALVDGKLREVASMRSALSHPEDAECSGARCAKTTFDVGFEMRFDATNPTRAAYPLLVHESGTECGAKVDRDQVVAFDAEAGKYLVPPELQREGCLRDMDEDAR
jgi:hypothetical protein